MQAFGARDSGSNPLGAIKKGHIGKDISDLKFAPLQQVDFNKSKRIKIIVLRRDVHMAGLFAYRLGSNIITNTLLLIPLYFNANYPSIIAV